FEQNGQICAIGFTKAGFWKNKKAQDMREIMKNSDLEYEIKPPSIEVMRMFENDYNTLKTNNEVI
ncbi:hypothetical protein ACFS5M_12740, partial [Lacinutrix iliipiscaria]